ncbi:hypothetical protein ACKGJO_07430 [Gracilimonas sp. Q87]|uniref:hypothetical protein n=1 Tax=Gracilimonas sp. Q87 TaxID=3384766 RepID=UPI0039843A4D
MRSKTNIATIFLTLGVFGIMLSMMHHHSDGLLCLHHAEEQHYTENELLCPVTGLIAVNSGDNPTDFNTLLQFQETLVEVQELMLTTEVHDTLLGRAPPFMI